MPTTRCEGGVTVRWCPHCGDCKCPAKQGHYDGWIEDPNCPIHGHNATHEPDSRVALVEDQVRQLTETVSKQGAELTEKVRRIRELEDQLRIRRNPAEELAARTYAVVLRRKADGIESQMDVCRSQETLENRTLVAALRAGACLLEPQ